MAALLLGACAGSSGSEPDPASAADPAQAADDADDGDSTDSAEGGDTDDSAESTDGTDSAEGGDTDDSGSGTTEEADDGDTVAAGSVIDLGGAQARHESGVVITLDRLVVEASYVVLEFNAANGSTDEVALAGDTRRGMVLTVDDPAAVMTYQAPRVNETMELSSGEVLEGEIVFLGILPADVGSMDVTFNPEPEPDGDVIEPTITFTGVPLAVDSGGG